MKGITPDLGAASLTDDARIARVTEVVQKARPNVRVAPFKHQPKND